MASDPGFTQDGHLDASRELAQSVEEAELFLYPGEQHLFAEVGLPSHDEAAPTSLRQRVLASLASLDAP